MKSAARGFLAEAARVLDVIGVYNPSPAVSPLLFLAGSLYLTVLASFSSKTLFNIVVIAYSLSLAAVARVDWRILGRLAAAAIALGVTPFIPLVFSRGFIGGLSDIVPYATAVGLAVFAETSSRVVAASLPLMVAALYLGWPSIYRALYVAGAKRIATALSLAATMLPRALRHMLELLLARESRIVGARRSTIWRVLASSTADLLYSSYRFSSALRLGIEARSVGGSPSIPGGGGRAVYNVLYVCSLAAITLLYAAGGW